MNLRVLATLRPPVEPAPVAAPAEVVQQRRVGRETTDLDAACAQVSAESGYPEAAEWADTFLRSRFSDADALTAFAPRDGRTMA